MPPSKAATRLPNAPLAEAVFEMRWPALGQAEVSPPLRHDPGYFPLEEAFRKAASRQGYRFERKLAEPGSVIPPSVTRRFYNSQEMSFPIWQIGPCVFAVNESTNYEWNSFKTMVLAAFKILMNSYPKIERTKFLPNFFELRYIDAFDQEIVGTTKFVEFINKATNIHLGIPTSLSAAPISGITEGRLQFSADSKKLRDTKLRLDIASGKRGDAAVIRMQTTVRTEAELWKYNRIDVAEAALAKWLEASHDITSPLFRYLISNEPMEKFRSASNAK